MGRLARVAAYPEGNGPRGKGTPERTSPSGPIQGAILHRLAHVLRLDSCRVGEIRYGTRDLQDAMVGPGREVEARDGRLEERVGGLGHSTIRRQIPGAHVGVRVDSRPLTEAFELSLPCRADALSNGFRGITRPVARQLLMRH